MFTAARQVTQVTDPNGNTTKATWDAHDKRLTSVDGLAKTTTATYNTNNTLSKITKPAGGTGAGGETTYTYPAPTSFDTLFEYRPLTSTNSEGQVTTFSYDVNTTYLKKTQTPGPSGGAGGAPTRNYQADNAGTNCSAQRGQLFKTTDGNGNVTSYKKPNRMFLGPTTMEGLRLVSATISCSIECPYPPLGPTHALKSPLLPSPRSSSSLPHRRQRR